MNKNAPLCSKHFIYSMLCFALVSGISACGSSDNTMVDTVEVPTPVIEDPAEDPSDDEPGNGVAFVQWRLELCTQYNKTAWDINC